MRKQQTKKISVLLRSMAITIAFMLSISPLRAASDDFNQVLKLALEGKKKQLRQKIEKKGTDLFSATCKGAHVEWELTNSPG